MESSNPCFLCYETLSNTSNYMTYSLWHTIWNRCMSQSMNLWLMIWVVFIRIRHFFSIGLHSVRIRYRFSLYVSYAALNNSEPYHSTPKSNAKSPPSTSSRVMTSSSFSTPTIYPGTHGSPSNSSSTGHNRTSPGPRGVLSSPVIGSSKVLSTPPKYHSASPLHNSSNKVGG